VRQTRGLQWITAAVAIAGAKPCDPEFKDHTHEGCPICTTTLMQQAEPVDEFCLIWIGKAFYPTPQHWTEEAMRMGVSRRLSTIPKRMVIGKTWVLVAHPEACEQIVKVKKEGELGEIEEVRKVPGIFHAFRPQAYELIVTPSMKKQKWVKDMVKKHGVKLVEVPEDDPDHAPTAPRKSARKRAMDKHARKLAPKKAKEQKAEAEA